MSCRSGFCSRSTQFLQGWWNVWTRIKCASNFPLKYIPHVMRYVDESLNIRALGFGLRNLCSFVISANIMLNIYEEPDTIEYWSFLKRVYWILTIFWQVRCVHFLRWGAGKGFCFSWRCSLNLGGVFGSDVVVVVQLRIVKVFIIRSSWFLLGCSRLDLWGPKRGETNNKTRSGFRALSLKSQRTNKVSEAFLGTGSLPRAKWHPWTLFTASTETASYAGYICKHVITFYRVWGNLRHLLSFAISESMGSSPGFSLKIGIGIVEKPQIYFHSLTIFLGQFGAISYNSPKWPYLCPNHCLLLQHETMRRTFLMQIEHLEVSGDLHGDHFAVCILPVPQMMFPP